MQADQKASTNGHTPFAEDRPDELDELRTAYRRQALAIDTLRAAVSRLRAGATALKEENTDLRGEIERLHGHGPAPGA